MKVNIPVLMLATAIALVLVIPSAARAQHKHTPSGPKKATMSGMSAEMSMMMKSPHHMLMTAHMKSMSDFARALRAQAMKPEALDVEFARSAVAELRHNLDATEAVHQQHMQGMSTEMKSKMDKARSMLKDQVSARETDVQADTPDSKQVAADSNALLKQLGMMSKMNGGSKAGNKKMEMKKKPEMKM